MHSPNTSQVCFFFFFLSHDHFPGLSSLALLGNWSKGKSAASPRWAPRWPATLASDTSSPAWTYKPTSERLEQSPWAEGRAWNLSDLGKSKLTPGCQAPADEDLRLLLRPAVQDQAKELAGEETRSSATRKTSGSGPWDWVLELIAKCLQGKAKALSAGGVLLTRRGRKEPRHEWKVSLKRERGTGNPAAARRADGYILSFYTSLSVARF